MSQSFSTSAILLPLLNKHIDCVKSHTYVNCHFQVSITVDHYNSNLRHLIYHMPNTYDTIISYPISATDGAAMLKIANGSTFYSLHLAGLSLPTNAYTAVVIPQACRKHNAGTSG